ncbi:MAG: bifunctional 3'-5' exonuclease/DNA polymerase [Oscillospiraceae bacterium]|nr:bifunctional 3'-5' exonuclease/DNA polymerase [Oscillospiraceae bacterium]
MEYIVITSKEALLPYLPTIKRAKVLAVDTETTGLDPHTARVRLIQLAGAGFPILIVDCFAYPPGDIAVIKELLEGPNVKIFQNAKFDLQFFMKWGIRPAPVFDTMLASRLLQSSGGPPRSGLAALASHYLGEDVDKGEQTADWGGELREAQLLYAARDVDVLPRLREAMVRELYANQLARIAQVEFACAHAVAEMEYNGVCLDSDRWAQLAARTEKERDAALDALREYAGAPVTQMSLWGDGVVMNHNFDSNQYVLELLRSHGIEADATSKRVLSAHAGHPLIQAIGAYRKAAKSLSSFLYPIPQMINKKTGRLHPHYMQIGAWSGRMSCGGPNIQQIPRDASFRACFVAPPGKNLIIADYSQIELRVAAQISGDARMIAAYSRGEDLHALTASLVSEIDIGDVTPAQRQAAKAVNFGLIFGMGAAGLQQYAQQSYGVDMTLEQAEAFRNGFFRAYPGVAEWHRRVRGDRRDDGRTLFGRKFLFGGSAGLAGRYNTPVQGTAADIAKAALGELSRRLAGTGAIAGARIIAAVHDEIILEADEGAASEAAADSLKSTMERAGAEALRDVPCVADVEISQSW